MMITIAQKKIESMIGLMAELQEDTTVPRNVKEKLMFCTSALQDETEMSLKVDKVRSVLEEISEDTNLQSYTRTQIWNITSLLERM